MARPSRTGGKISEAKGRNASPGKGGKTTKTKPRIAPAATRAKRRSTSHPGKDLKEAREQQAATAEILKVIASSPSDVQPVFDAIAHSAKRLIGGFSTAVHRVIDDIDHLVAFTPTNPESDEVLKAAFPRHRSEMPAIISLVENGETAQIVDSETADGQIRKLARARGWRSATYTPLMNQGTFIGFIVCTRRETGMLADHHVQLLRTFADQAVIAIENTRLFNETRQALERQTATADILKVIASSPDDVQPVFDAIARRANTLIGGFSSTVFRFIDGIAYLEAFTPTTPAADEVLKTTFPRPVADYAPFRMAQAGEVAHIPDTEASTYELQNISRARGYRSMLYAPLMSDGMSIGFIAVTRVQPGTFPDHHVQLLQTFADQAVIAIENVRLFDEVQAKTRDLSEALTYQTGSANILSVIASSPTDVGPVLKAIVESACELCEAYDAVVLMKDGDDLRFSAHQGPIAVRLDKFRIGRSSVTGRSVIDRTPVHIHDVLSDEGAEFPEGQEHSRRDGFRSILSVPMLREGESIGAIALRRIEAQPFTDKQIALLQTFADQAVIAIGNVRMFEQVQQRTRDLTESLEQQTATSEVLEVISASAGELEPVFQKMLENATRVCGAQFGVMSLWDGTHFNFAAGYDVPPAFAAARKNTPIPPIGALAKVIETRRFFHIHDVRSSPGYLARAPHTVEIAELAGARTLVIVPMLKENELIGIITIYRQEVKPFTDKQIALVENFTKQAVIAIENTRLLNELRKRTDDLSESLEQQTATSEVLEVISASTGELEPVFKSMLDNATRICGANFGTMNLYENGAFRPVAFYNVPQAYAEKYADTLIRPHPQGPLGTLARTHEVVHVEDTKSLSLYIEGNPAVVAISDLAGARTIVIVPMLRENELIGTIAIYRQEVRPFSEKQISLLTNFAKQAVIAIENTRLLKELRQRTDDLSQSLDDLRSAQDRLVQTEKLASLGQLTAGIAHEIKNPLNFVNNFSALSAELTDELNDVLKPVAMDGKVRGEVDELTGLLKDNLEKVVQHGKRADSIVKNMLLHSREGSGEHRPADINALLDESLNLAYHGARAEKGEFNITVQRDFDADAGTIELFPQEITRAFLNLIANGVYAATRRKTEDNEPGFEPTLRAITKNLGTTVEIRIRDNGTGILAEVQEKMFNPFFTTKPAGEGTGLGLSMTHDIIVKQHGGRIDVATEPGQFTEITIVLPRKSNLSGGDRGKT